MLAHRLPDFVGALLTPVAYLAVMFVFDWLLGLLCLVPIVVSALCMAWMMAGGAKDENANAMTFMRNYQDALDRMNKAAVEYVRGIPVVKVFQQTVRSFSTFRESMVAYRDFATAYVKLCSPPQVAQLVAINCTFAVLVPAGILLARGAGDFSAFFTDFLFYVVFSALTTMMMTKVMYASQAMTEAQDAVSRIEDILGTLPMDEVDADRAREPKGNSIDFYHVRFRYPGAAQDVLSDVTFSVEHGTTVALVGPSAAARRRSPRWCRASGTWPKAPCASATWTCATSPRAFDGARGVRLPERAAVQAEPCRQHPGRTARCDPRPGGGRRARRPVRRHSGEAAGGAGHRRGDEGGLPLRRECQRVALARAILKDAPIVVLDEATAFADPENEVLIQRALAELTRGKTVLMIAHRLSTVVNADAILVLEGGRLVERGTHADLVAAGGLYARMWDDYRTSATWRIEGGKGAGDAA